MADYYRDLIALLRAAAMNSNGRGAATMRFGGILEPE
jgi:hypothetical protein